MRPPFLFGRGVWRRERTSRRDSKARRWRLLVVQVLDVGVGVEARYGLLVCLPIGGGLAEGNFISRFEQRLGIDESSYAFFREAGGNYRGSFLRDQDD